MTITAANTGFWRWLVGNSWARRIFYHPILPTLVVLATYLLLDWPHWFFPAIGGALSVMDVFNRYLDWRSLRRNGRLFLQGKRNQDGPIA